MAILGLQGRLVAQRKIKRYIYTYIYTYIHTHIYVFIHIHVRERERESAHKPNVSVCAHFFGRVHVTVHAHFVLQFQA